MRKKEKRSISIDPELWNDVQDVAAEVRTSASWVTEAALREYVTQFGWRRGYRRDRPARKVTQS